MQKIIADILGVFQLFDISHYLIPHVGVGGAVEAKEHVDIVPLIKFTLIFLAGVGAIFGLGLALAAKRFAVKIDPRVEQVKDVLAHAHCGACGFAGCEQYAEAVVNNKDVSPNLCIPAGSKGAEAVALITGKKTKETESARDGVTLHFFTVFTGTYPWSTTTFCPSASI
ncbi:MAG: RnfABCDGE type electron transport complex subunit B [Nitrospirae bacterium]|nr:RnfABCDGE type electron transport complex subunit B [Nitrospirota bacterium]